MSIPKLPLTKRNPLTNFITPLEKSSKKKKKKNNKDIVQIPDWVKKIKLLNIKET